MDDDFDLFSKILQLKIPEEIPANIPPDIALVYRSLSFPKTNSLQNIALNQQQKLDVFLKESGFVFPIIPTLFLLIENHEEKQYEQSISDFLSIFIFYSHLSWIVYTSETNDYQYTSFLLDSYPFVFNSTLSDLLFQSFSSILKSYINNCPSFQLDDIFQSLVDLSTLNFFKEMDEEKHKTIENIFCNILEKLYHQDYKNQNLQSIILEKYKETEQIMNDCDVFVSFLSEIILEGFHFSTENYEKIFSNITNSIILLDKEYLLLFSSIANSISTDKTIPVIQQIAISLLTLFQANNYVPDFHVEESKIHFNNNFDLSINFTYLDDTFKNGIDIHATDLSSKNDLKSIFPSEINYLLKTITTILINSPSFIPYFIDNYENNMKSNNEEILALILLIESVSLSENECIQYLKILLKHPIFNPNISSFNNGEPYSMLNSWRIAAIKALKISNYRGINYIVNKLETQFYLFPILIQVIITDFSFIRPEEIKSLDFIKSIVTASTFYQLQHQTENSSSLEIIEKTRKAIFQLFSLISSNESFKFVWYNEPIFVIHLLSLLCEKAINSIIFDMIYNQFLDNIHIQLSSVFITELIHAIKALNQHFPNENYISIATNFIEILFKSIPKTDCNSELFQIIIDTLIDSFPKLSSSIGSHIYFINAIRVLGITFDEADFKYEYYSIIGKTCKNLTKPKYFQYIMNEFMLNLGTSNINNEVESIDFNLKTSQRDEENKQEKNMDKTLIFSSKSKFYIKHAQILAILLEICSSDEERKQNLEYIKDLITGSIYNKKAAFNGKLDIYLLNKLNEMKNNPKENDLFDDIALIIAEISPYFSSKQSFNLFCHLLFPINQFSLSIYQTKLLLMLRKIIFDCTTNPRYYYSAFYKQCGSPITVSNIPSQVLSSNFSLGAHLYLENIKNDNIFLLWRILSSQTSLPLFNIFLIDSKLYVSSSNNFSDKKEFNIELETGKWFYLGINFVMKEENEFLITCKTNNKESNEILFKVGQQDYLDQLISIQIAIPCIINKDSQEIELFSNFDLSQNDLEFPSFYISSFDLYTNSHTFTWNNFPDNYIFNVDFEPQETNIIPNLHSSNSDLVISGQQNICISENLLESFSCEKGFQILIRLLSEFHLLDPKNQSISNLSMYYFNEIQQNANVFDYFSLCLKIFNHIFSFSPNSQEIAYNLHFPNLLSYLFESNKVTITFNIYTTLYTISQNIRNRKLLKSYFKHILLNTILLFDNADSKETVLSILQHWNNVIFPKYSLIVSSVFQIHQFTSFIKKHVASLSNIDHSLILSSINKEETIDLSFDSSSTSSEDDEYSDINTKETYSGSSSSNTGSNFFLSNPTNSSSESTLTSASSNTSPTRIISTPSDHCSLIREKDVSPFIEQNISPIVSPITTKSDDSQNDNQMTSDEDKIVKEFMTFILKIFLNPNVITEKNILYLLGECLVSTNIPITKIFLSTIKAITKGMISLLDIPKTKEIITDICKHYLLLHHLVSYSDEEMYMDIIDIFIMCYKNSLIVSIPFDMHVTYLISVTPQKVCTNNILKFLVNHVNNGFIELVSLCALVSCELGDDTIFVENITNTKGIIDTSNRLLWLLIMFGRSKTHKHNLFQMIHDENLMPVIGIVLQILQAPYLCENIAIQYLEIAVENFLLNINNLNNKNVITFLKISYYSIFFQMKSVNDLWVENMIYFSPFAPKFRRKTSSLFLPLYLLLEKSIDRAINEEYVFTLHIADNGKWFDTNFALKLLTLYEKVQDPDLAPYDICLCGFLLRTHPIDVLAHLKSLNKEILQPKQNKNMILKVNAKKNLFYNLNFSCLDFINNYEESKFDEFKSIESIAEICPFKESVVTIAKKLKGIQEQSKQEEKKIMTSINKNIVESTIKKDKTLLIKDKLNKLENLNNIQSIYNELSLDQFKINYSFNIQKKWERSNILVSDNLIPSKLIENNHFIHHSYITKNQNKGINDFPLLKDENQEIVESFISMKQNKMISHDEYLIKLITIYGEKTAYFKITNQDDFEINLIEDPTKGHKDLELYLKQKYFLKKEDISSIYEREYLHEENKAVEIFMKEGNSYFILFQSNNGIPIQYTKLTNKELEKTTKKWLKYEISTFDYLLALNRFSSRSFNSLSQYPIFPWVIKDYTSSSLDLNNDSIYRDFSLPFPLITQEKQQNYIERNKIIQQSSQQQKEFHKQKLEKEENDKFKLNDSKQTNDKQQNSEDKANFHILDYAQICPIDIFYYLIREEPFSTYNVLLKCENYDNLRIFKSINETFQNKEFNSELIPEFFFSSSFLENRNTFDLGLEQNNENVELPPWANNSAMEFVYMNRKCLESSYVSQHINEWIDLIWGVDQNKYSHLYNSSLYKGKNSNKELMKEFGVIPNKLFNTKHPIRSEFKSPIPHQQINFDLPLYESLACFEENNNQIIIGIDKNKLIQTNLENIESYNETKQEITPIPQVKNPIIISLNSFVGISQDEMKIIKFCSNKIEESYPAATQIKIIESDNDFLITIMKDSSLYIWKINQINLPIFTLLSLNDTPISCCISSKFDTAAVGTSNGNIRLISLSEERETNHIFCSEIPIKIHITPKWGFIIVFTNENNIIVYDINGRFIRKKQLPSSINSWCFWSDKNGFDFCALNLQNSIVIIFEVFYLNFKEIGSINFTSSFITYNNDSSSLSILSTKGKGTKIYIS